MDEKVIHEVRLIETEDGFRIEVKGDKEYIRRMGFGPGLGLGAHFGWRFGRRMWGRRWRGYGPRFGPWGWWWDDEPEQHDEPPLE